MFGDDIFVAYPLLFPYKLLPATSPHVAECLSCSFVCRPFHFCGRFILFFLMNSIFLNFQQFSTPCPVANNIFPGTFSFHSTMQIIKLLVVATMAISSALGANLQSQQKSSLRKLLSKKQNQRKTKWWGRRRRRRWQVKVDFNAGCGDFCGGPNMGKKKSTRAENDGDPLF